MLYCNTHIEVSSKMRLEIWRRAMLLHRGKQPAMDLAKQVQGDLHFSCFSQENNSDDRDHTEVPIGAVSPEAEKHARLIDERCAEAEDLAFE